MVSFQQKITAGFVKRGIEVCNDTLATPYDAILLIGGTRNLLGLWEARRKGIPVIQRLNGMNWLHRINVRKKPKHINIRHFLRAEYGNLLLAFIRRNLASHIVYQSQFVLDWWERIHGLTPVSNAVIYNGADLDLYKPDIQAQRTEESYRLLLVEGSLLGGYEYGLEIATSLLVKLGKDYKGSLGKPVELIVVGRVMDAVQRKCEEHVRMVTPTNDVNLVWAGLVPNEQIPEIDNHAHVLFSADVNAACPNSVIEALACGLPVVSFDTGALPELVTGNSGKLVPYGGDSWKLERPDIDGLAQACVDILLSQYRFRDGARIRAETAFDLDVMVEAYLKVLL